MPHDITDYLIIGGGSAGCVLAARLSEDAGVHVTLVEAGGEGRGTLIDTPAALVAMLPTRVHNWAFQTVPQPGLNGRRGYQPRGRALGGSSAVNAMVYARGHRSDYDHWLALGNPGWGYDDVLPYFCRAEHNERFCGPYHGKGGPLNVADSRTDNPFHKRFLQAAREAGFPINEDFNGAEQEGLGIFQLTQRDGRRCSAAHAYLHPVMHRSNLRVITGATAQRLVLEGRRAVGAVLRANGRDIHIAARSEVVVSAGTFQSPQLLMVSGIGPGSMLQAAGVDVRHELRGVGKNLQDHIDFIFGHLMPSTDLMGLSPAGLWHTLRQVGRWRREGRGLLTSNFAECGGFLKLHPHSPAPDVQLHFVTAVVEDHARRVHARHGYSCHVALLRPASRGEVGIEAPGMDTPPRIDPRFFSRDEDLQRMVQAFRLTRRLLKAPALADQTTKDLFTEGVHTDEQIRQVLRDRSDTVYHPVGTCRMGPDAMAVVDAHLRVHGIDALRVVDASVMPTIIGGNTNAPTIMIAERAAELMRMARRARVGGSADWLAFRPGRIGLEGHPVPDSPTSTGDQLVGVQPRGESGVMTRNHPASAAPLY